MKKKYLIIAIIVVVLLLIFFLLFPLDKMDKSVVYKDYVISSGVTGSVERYDPSLAVDGYMGGSDAYYISGKIKTIENKDFSVITYNLYDKDDNLLGTAVAGLNKLEKQKNYDFKAVGIVKQGDEKLVDHFELKSVELGN